jgi:hypothetical protein
MLRFCLSIFLIVSSLHAYANPAPIGIEINSTTVKELQSKVKILKTFKSTIPGYTVSQLDRSQIDMPALKYAYADSNKEGVIESLKFTLDKTRFNEINDAIAAKYTLLKSDIPFVGDKFSLYEEGDTYIFLIADHLSFEMSLTYMTKKYFNLLNTHLDAENKAKKEKTVSQL